MMLVSEPPWTRDSALHYHWISANSRLCVIPLDESSQIPILVRCVCVYIPSEGKKRTLPMLMRTAWKLAFKDVMVVAGDFTSQAGCDGDTGTLEADLQS